MTWGGKKFSAKHVTSGFDWTDWWRDHLPMFLFDRGPKAVTFAGQAADSTARRDAREAALKVLTTESLDEVLRAEAALALGRLGGPGTLEALTAIVAAESADTKQTLGTMPRLRSSAVMGLAHFDDDAAREAIRLVLVDYRFPREVRAIAAAAYGVARGDVASLRIPMLPEGSLAQSLGFYMEEDLAAGILGLAATGCIETGERLVSEARDETSKYLLPHYLAAAAMVGELTATPMLIDALRHKDRFVRETAITSLGGLLDDTGRMTRTRISETALDSELLAKCKKDASRALKNIVRKNPRTAMRCLAAISLGRIGGRDNVKTLRFVLAEEHGQLRACAALGLGLSGAREAQESLVSLLSDTSEIDACRAAGAIALGLIGDVDTSTRKRLQAMLSRGVSSTLRGYACQAIGLIGDAVAVPKLAAVAAEDRVLEVRLDASIGLSLIGNTAALEAQRKLLATIRHDAVRAAFVRTLGSHASDASLAFLVNVLESATNATEAASALHAIGHVANPVGPPLHARLLCDRPDALAGKPFTLIREIL